MSRRAVRIRVPAASRTLLREVGRIAEAAGARAFAVGGCVRDWLLGIDGIVDLDVTVEGDGICLAREMRRELGGRIREHAQFGTARIAMSGRPSRQIDVASCRRETYARPGAYPRVEPGTLREDLSRRDFTMNAMAVTLAPGRFGMLVDPFHGARDLELGRLRALHARSFLDDPSRVLRGIRFASRLGLRWERRTALAATAAVSAGALGWLNAGRLQRELERMAQEPDPRGCFEELAAVLGGKRVG